MSRANYEKWTAAAAFPGSFGHTLVEDALVEDAEAEDDVEPMRPVSMTRMRFFTNVRLAAYYAVGAIGILIEDVQRRLR